MAPEQPIFLVNDTIRTKDPLGRKGSLGSPENKRARRAGACGLITGQFRQWFLVQHPDATDLAIYDAEELEPEPHAYWRVRHPVKGIPFFKEFATHAEVTEYIDELTDTAGVAPTIEGPFYSSKELEEGVQDPKSLFDHLINDV